MQNSILDFQTGSDHNTWIRYDAFQDVKLYNIFYKLQGSMR